MGRTDEVEKTSLDEELQQKVLELAQRSRELADLFEVLAFSETTKQRDGLTERISDIMTEMDDIILNYFDVDIDLDLD